MSVIMLLNFPKIATYIKRNTELDIEGSFIQNFNQFGLSYLYSANPHSAELFIPQKAVAFLHPSFDYQGHLSRLELQLRKNVQAYS
jgi:hypothetical protein